MDLKLYREVIPNQASHEKVKEIVLNTGGSQSTLQDIKVTERANGYCYKYFPGRTDRNRFIYWRTYNDVLELSEVSLDATLTDNHIRYKFTESPVLSVHISEQGNESVVILVATVNSLHRLSFQHPERLNRNDANTYRSRSIFSLATAQEAKDPASFFVFGQNSSSNPPVPHSASCSLSDCGGEAYFAFAHNTNLILYTMSCSDGQTVSTELRQNQIVPRILTNFAGALRGKNTSDGNFVNSMLFKPVEGQLFLYALYRDDQIRMWSVKRHNCVASVNILQDYGEQRIQGSQCEALSSGPDNTICAFLNFSAGGSEFKTFATHCEAGAFSLCLSSTIPAPQFDLVDYQLVRNRIWALWCNSEGDFDVSTICLSAGSINWVSVALEAPPDQSDINGSSHARQEYCNYIFSPGRFQAATIAKALVMFRRTGVPVDADLPMHKLRERVCQAIECEMQNEIKDLDVTDEEYIDINLQLWERFYSCCEQYHLKATRPLGLVSLEPLGGMCCVKRSLFSLVRPCELLEHVMLSSGAQPHPAAVVRFPQFQSRRADENLAKLIAVLGRVQAVLPSAVQLEVFNQLLALQMPGSVVSEIVRQFLSLDVDEQPFTKDFIAEVRQQLLQISDVPLTMCQLLECLQLVRDGERTAEQGSGDDEPMDTFRGVADMQRHLLELGSLFCGQVGKSFVAESLKQVVMVRYALCRNLLILQHLLQETFSLPNEVLKRIQSECQADTAVSLQAYFVMKWLCLSPVSVAQLVASQKNDSLHQVLHSLQLYETFPRQSSATGAVNQLTLLEYFLHGRGSILALAQLAEAEEGEDGPESETATLEVLRETADWEFTLHELLRRVGRLIWPMSRDFVFGEWLIGSGQSLLVEEYVRLLNGWCQWGRCSREFILAVTQLNQGELYKAFDHFMAATGGVAEERFLWRRVLRLDGPGAAQEVPRQALVAQYYMRVLQLFEQKPALDCVIRMARAAIEILGEVPEVASPTVPRKAMFQSIVFMNQLKLEHYEEAYDSLINNVEEQRRREGLRQLVVCLFQKRRLDLLLHFPYVGLQAEFEHIVEQRARSMGVEENVHYKFLYAHHVAKENMRKAAFCMYEQAMRLQLECDSAAAMEARYESLLVCVNALHLVDARYQFIAKPVVTREQAQASDKLQVEVLEVADVKRELVHTEALLALHRATQQQGRTDGAVMRLDAQELVGVLSSAHLFTMAVRLAEAFKLTKAPVVKALTATCIDLATEDVIRQSEAWNWLQENNVTDLPASNSSVDTAWNLLRRIIEENEKDAEGATVELKRAAIEAVLSSTTAFVPRWLLDSMKRANANVLLHLFVKYGRLVEASEFAVELVWAMLGRGHEYFGLHNPLLANGAPLCFPVNTMDLLVYNLRVNVEENGEKLPPGDLDELKGCLKGVTEVCEYYKGKAREVSQYKATYERQIANRMEV